MNTQQIKEFYYRNFDRKGITRNGDHEEHDVASLSKRLMLDPQTVHDLIAAGHLQPVSTSEDGSRLGFESDHLDEIRKHVVDQAAGDAENGAATLGNFAAARALLNLQRKSEVAAAKHQQLVKLNRLASLRPDIEFGLGAELLQGAGGIAKKFLGSSIGQSTVGHGAIGAGIGSVLGAGKALVHNAIDSNPQDHESVLGGALKGGVAGAAVGGAYGAFKGAGAGGATPGLPSSPGPVNPPGGMGGMKPASATVVTPSPASGAVGGSPSPGGSDPSGGNQPWWKKYQSTSAPQQQTVNASSRRSTMNFGATYEDIVISKFHELKAGGMNDIKAKSEAFSFGVHRHGSAYIDFRKRGGTIDFAALRPKSPGGLNTEEVASGVPSGQMLPATSGQSQPIYDKAQTVATRRIAGVAESAQGDVDPQDPWSDSHAVNVTNNPEFINGDRDTETQRILSKIHRLNGRKMPGRATASM